jgi:hypothetical protein
MRADLKPKLAIGFRGFTRRFDVPFAVELIVGVDVGIILKRYHKALAVGFHILHLSLGQIIFERLQMVMVKIEVNGHLPANRVPDLIRFTVYFRSFGHVRGEVKVEVKSEL